MNKNTVHNFNILIKNNSPLESSEDLTKSFIKELAQVSKEINEQKDIVQIWQEQNASNNVMNNTLDSAGEGVFDTNAAIKTVPSFSNTSSASGSNLFTGSTLNASIGGGAFDSTESTIMSSFGSTGNTLPVSEAENTVLSNAFSQIYESIDAKQMLTVPQMLQSNSNEPSMELIKAEIKKKLDLAIKENNPEAIQYWTRISKAFDDEKTVIADFVDKPNEMLFTEMYNALKQLTATSAEVQNFNWNVVREKMIKAIEANILKGSISKAAKSRWETIKKQLADDKTNVANLFERYDELFLLLKEVEGLDALPNSITITTKTKIYPNLSADKLYASIGKEDVYVFLKQVNETDLDGSGVNKGAVKIKNANATSFIVGESLEFFVDEAFINQKVNQKENVNWIVYNSKTVNDNIFENEGTSFSYNFDTPGTYRIDAYGKNHTVKQKKSAATATFIELKIVAQDIIITPPAIAKAEFIRPFAEEKTFKVSLKNTAIKTLNPMKLYYQIETVVGGKNAVISEERELDSTGIIKLAMPDLGVYKIKVASKDQYGLNKEFKTSVIKNEVISIGHVKDTPNKNVFLLGNPSNALTLEAKTFKINPPTDTEKKDVKWIIHDSNNKLYVPDGEVIINENKNPQKPYIHKWDFYDVPIPQKIGFYKIEAYCNDKKGPKDGVTFKMEVKQPEITEAYWAWSGGSKKTISGLLESNWINVSIPHYNNQTVRIYFYLDTAKTNHYIDVKTNSKGEIFEEVKFDTTFQKAIGLGRKKNAKIGFKLLGIQNSKPYPFKSPANYDANTTLSLTADKKVLDVYFTYDGNRVTPEDEVPFGKKGAIVTIVAKTQNMIGEEIVLKAHKKNQKPSFVGKATVNTEGVAKTSFLLKNLDKKLKQGSKINYHAGVEGCFAKHLTNNVLVMIVGEGKKIFNTGIYKSHFDKNIEHIFDVEGGYVNDKDDKGGRTNMGITYMTYENFYKTYKPKMIPTEEKHRNLSVYEAKEIYKIEFWNKIHGDEIYNASVALYILDFSINSGVYNATTIVQETLKNDFQLNISIDGSFGTSTLNAINQLDSSLFYQKLDKNRRKFVDNIIKNNPSQSKYEKGWQNRLKKLEYKKEDYTINQKIENWLKKDYKKSPIKDKNSSIANLILEAHALNLVEFNSEGTIGAFSSGLGGTQDTFIKIRDGIEIGNEYGDAKPKTKFDPTQEDIPVIETSLKIIQSNVKNWVDNNYKPKEPNKLKLGSFMVWNVSGKKRIAGALRPTKHGNKASAIDFNFSTFSNGKIDFSKPDAERMVLEIIQRLPIGDYGFGLPKQGNFFPANNALTEHSTYYQGVYNKAYTQLKSEEIKKELEKRMKYNKIIVFPDFENHLHIQLE